MNGCLIPQTPIAVDFWKIRECPQARIFFLTHLHGDHITGLTSSWSYPIYCSEVTGKLLVQRYGLREDLIHSLQVDCAEIIYLDADHQEQMTVTALEACHCPGAIMFLMEGYFGTILHTGDFRYHPDMISQSVLSKYSGKVDVLFLDNTYCAPNCVFPTRDEATSRIIDIMERHPEHDVLIAMRNLGKENLLCKIAMHFHEWISVPDKFYKTLEILGAPDVFDNSLSDHRIRVVPFHKVSNKFVNQVNEERRTIVILPTALYHGIEAVPYENNDNVFVVPYSDHSSFTELRKFVSFVRPKKIIPIVKSNSRGPFGLSIAERADMTVFADFISDDWISKIKIPISVQAFMHNKNHKLQGMVKKGLKRKSSLKVSQAKKVKRGVTYESPKSVSQGNCRSPEKMPQKSFGTIGSENEKENHDTEDTARLLVKRTLFNNKSVEVNIGAENLTMELHGKQTTGERRESHRQDFTKLERDKQLPADSSSTCKQIGVKLTHKNFTVKGNAFLKFFRSSNEKVNEKCKNVNDQNREKSPKRHEMKIDSHPTGESRIVEQNTKIKDVAGYFSRSKKETATLKKVDTEKNIEIPKASRKCSKTCTKARTAVKIPLQFAASEDDFRFDTIVAMKTYSKSSSDKIHSLNKKSLKLLQVVGNEKEMRMNKTAQWVLENTKYKADMLTPEEAVSNDTDEEVEDVWEHNYDEIHKNENRNEGLKKKSKVSSDLKQSELSKYFRRTNEESSKSDPLTNQQELYIDKRCQRGNMNLQTQYQNDADLEESESGKEILVINSDTDSVEANNRNKGTGKVQGKNVEDSVESTEEEFENENNNNNSDGSVNAQVGTQVRDLNVSLKHNDLQEKKSLARKHSDEIVKNNEEENSHEKEPGDQFNDSAVLVFAQVSTQAQNSNVKGKCSTVKENNYFGVHYLNKIVADEVEEKSNEMENSKGFEDERNLSSNESSIAQTGTQMNTSKRKLRINNLTRDNSVAINETNVKDKSVTAIVKIKSPEKGSKCENLDGSSSILLDARKVTKQSATLSNSANDLSVGEEIKALVNDNLGNKVDQFKTNKNGQLKSGKNGEKFGKGNPSITLKDRTSEKQAELEDSEEADMSVCVNVGTQRDIRELERNDYSLVDDGSKIIAGVGKQSCNKGSRTSRLTDNGRKYNFRCKLCEMDAFRQVFKQLEESNLREGSKEPA